MHNNFVVRVILVFHCLVASAFAQEATWSDFLFQFQDCYRIKTTMTCSVLVTNQKQRRELSLGYTTFKLFDNLGNEVTSSVIRFTSNGLSEKELISGVSAEMEFEFDGVSPQASNIAILNLDRRGVEFSNLSFSELQPQTTQQTVYNNYLYELQGCNKVDTTITCLLTITNRIQNRELGYAYSNLRLFDNLGNEFQASEKQFTSNGSGQKNLTTGVPAEFKIIFNGVFSEASDIALLDLHRQILFRHIPFSNPQPLTDYDIGKEAGKQECLANPASCGIVSYEGKNAYFYPNNGKLYLPFVNVPDTSGKVTVYQVELNQQAPEFVFELDVESIQQVSEEQK